MHTALAGFGSLDDTALSDTARELRTEVRSAVNPPGTSRQIRREQMQRLLHAAIFSSGELPIRTTAVRRLFASVGWAEAFIDGALATAPEPDIAVDSDGDVLFEWLYGPRDVLTVSVGPAGVINFASLTGSSRFHGVTRIGDQLAGPLLTCLDQIKSRAAA